MSYNNKNSKEFLNFVKKQYETIKINTEILIDDKDLYIVIARTKNKQQDFYVLQNTKSKERFCMDLKYFIDNIQKIEFI